MRRISYLILCIIVCVGGSASCMSTLYLVKQASGGAGSSDTLLKYEYDEVSTVGPIGFTDVRGLAYDASSGMLYGVSRSNDTRLITINPATGAGTAVSANPYLSANSNTAEISFRADGALFGAGHRYSQSATDTLFSVNTTTGIASDAGSFGSVNLSGLAFDHYTGILYGSNYDGRLYVINQTTGAAIAIGDIWGSYGKVTRIAFDQVDGRLYGITNYSQLVRIDLLTLRATRVCQFNVDTQIYAMDFQNQTPEPATMLMLGLGILGLIRRK